MDFNSFVDTVSGMCAVLSVEKKPDGTAGEIRIVAANKAYQDSMDGKYFPNCLYTDLVPPDIKFEDFCLRAAHAGQRIHYYVPLIALNCWSDNAIIPLKKESESLGYCQFLIEFTPQEESSRRADVSAETAAAVVKACLQLRGSDDLALATRQTIRDIRSYCGANRCCVLLVNTKRRFLRILAEDLDISSSDRPTSELLTRLTYDIVDSWPETIGISDCVIAQDEHDMDALAARNAPWVASMRWAGVSSVVLFPLKMKKELLGYIWMTNFDTDRVVQIKETLSLVTYFLASEVANDQLLQQLETMGMLDLLTGVQNRNAMNRRVDLFVSGEKKLKGAFAVVFVDLNGLKTLNDIGGHAAGDELLQQAARVLQEVFPDDEIYRAGGDEFVVLLEDCTEASLAEKLSRLEARTSEPGGVSFAVGSYFDGEGKDLRWAMHMADERMYENKAQFYRDHPERKRRD